MHTANADLRTNPVILRNEVRLLPGNLVLAWHLPLFRTTCLTARCCVSDFIPVDADNTPRSPQGGNGGGFALLLPLSPGFRLSPKFCGIAPLAAAAGKRGRLGVQLGASLGGVDSPLRRAFYRRSRCATSSPSGSVSLLQVVVNGFGGNAPSCPATSQIVPSSELIVIDSTSKQSAVLEVILLHQLPHHLLLCLLQRLVVHVLQCRGVSLQFQLPLPLVIVRVNERLHLNVRQIDPPYPPLVHPLDDGGDAIVLPPRAFGAYRLELI
mmetsp:Transcript_22945/g.49213  ORF Transcript_22945/g.49213 Transcript_22945/m.49213 type:complete len:267 (-) Transcript_22945:198-998(-)